MVNVYVGNYMKIYLPKKTVAAHLACSSCGRKRLRSNFCPDCGSKTTPDWEERYQHLYEIIPDDSDLLEKFYFAGKGWVEEGGGEYTAALPNASQCGYWIEGDGAQELVGEPWHSDFEELARFLDSEGISFERQAGAVCYSA